ncbi:ABC transporter permease [Marinitoga arctica]
MIIEMMKEALRALFYNKTRSFLSMLGIIIGVLAVIIVLSLGNGATYSVKSEIESMGSNIFFVIAKGSRYYKLTTADLEELRMNAQFLTNITPSFSSGGTFKYATNEINAQFYGVIPDFIKMFSLEVEKGRMINELDNDGILKVAVIGSSIAEQLFNDENPIGKTIKLSRNKGSINFAIIGVIKPTGSKLFLNVDNTIFIPYETMDKRVVKIDVVNQFFAKANSSELNEEAKNELENFLYSRFKDEKAYVIISQEEILGTINQVTGMLNLTLGAIAGISLLVGGIGIMNIMLVSVTERTREIGIKKAIGATNSNVLMQFLTESIFLTITAGVIGIFSGIYLSNIIGKFINIEPFFDINQIILAFIVSGAIGLFFGVYPAVKASRLNPVDALRYE